MSLTTYFQALRSAPETRRRRVALVSSTALTLLIAVGWLINMGVLFPPQYNYQQTQTAVVTDVSAVNVLANIGERFKKGFKVLTDLF